ncbi:unnamed protein product [Urochloa decumbens]|uniref:Vinculin n=1 Tax=Urochloa decumbens TaxID=240449 RepID=A0ABC9BYU0_9POAL
MRLILFAQNKEDCLDIKKRVQRINLTLSLLKGREELMKNQAISKATEALNETLSEPACSSPTARKTECMRGVFTVYQVVSLSKRTEYVSPPPSSIPNPSERPIEVVFSDITQPSPAAQLRSQVHETSNVAQQINEAMGTVRQNIQECTELGERVNSLSHVLELAHMEKVKDPAMGFALEKLRQAFERANTVIMECQKPKTTILGRLVVGHSNPKPKRKLSKEICEVSDQLVLAVYNIISIILPFENAPKALQLQQYPTLVDTLSFTEASSRPGPVSASTSRSSALWQNN